ncbi:hypothetical protein KW850_25215 [Bacillus sp. sid0103]|uniref:hypothetical protein n=1 Tax=Bacillus sp. sid0103 TaxID=2856337 RepID=UPI001C49099A|nr:hypothetical protein [Bacillus sp. sid0103]MBV7508520.1 hypothetical protein [Bacillus sp. sid0103]
MAMLKLIVDFGTLLIAVEGAKTPAGVSPDRQRTVSAWSGNQHNKRKWKNKRSS